MTRQEKQAVAAGMCVRIAEKIRQLDYFRDDAHIRVQFGEPGACRFKPGKSSQMRHRLKGRGIMLSVSHDWMESVYAKDLALIEDSGGQRVLTLAAHDARKLYELSAKAWVVPEDVPVWVVHYLLAGQWGALHTDCGYVVHFGGRFWMSQLSADHAFAMATERLLACMNGESLDTTIPF